MFTDLTRTDSNAVLFTAEYYSIGASLGAQVVKNLPAKQEAQEAWV